MHTIRVYVNFKAVRVVLDLQRVNWPPFAYSLCFKCLLCICQLRCTISPKLRRRLFNTSFTGNCRVSFVVRLQSRHTICLQPPTIIHCDVVSIWQVQRSCHGTHTHTFIHNLSSAYVITFAMNPIRFAISQYIAHAYVSQYLLQILAHCICIRYGF